MFCIVGKSSAARFIRGAFRDEPSQSPAATAVPLFVAWWERELSGRTLSVACGDSSPERGSPWQNRQVSSSFVNDRTSWPVTQKLYAFAKASTFGGGGISQSEMTEGVSSGTNPLSLAALDSCSPFCRLPATSSPGRGKSFEGRALGRTGKFRPHRLTAEEVNR